MTMTDNAAELGEVDVVATKPLVVKEIDRIGYDVQADEDSKTSTVQDVLRKVPMVTVDADGTIKVKGSTNFKIYKDGRPNNAFTNNAKDIFAAIPASMIKKIEVITDPGAKEDAEGVGAILNIVTNQETTMNGLMGNASLNWSTRSSSPMPNIWLTGNVGKLALSAYGGYHHQDYSEGKNSSNSSNTYVNTGNTLRNESNSKGKGNIAFWGIEGSYDIDSLNLITLEFGGFYYDAKNKSESFNEMVDPAGDMIYSYRTRSFTPKTRYLDFNGNVNYQRSTRFHIRFRTTITRIFRRANIMILSTFRRRIQASTPTPISISSRIPDSWTGRVPSASITRCRSARKLLPAGTVRKRPTSMSAQSRAITA